ncbi:DUF3846 domain-containing protein [Paenibacillus prosopidis]|uniref:Uncharacterized protein DUF3846 n=1 Tax=Paenibacillus prosopidis TaxID=630520 RepID=A0A368W2E6_9BACL|nr:DUF3846 domain-containing protein [Paenibacillus prosopidis]RCW48092.1 uncharacterized protein DUF3846 [Paenibacillus prosopidis]
MPKVLVAVPGEKLKINTVTESKTEISELIGGALECVQLGSHFVLYCNQDGNKQDLAVNPHFAQGIIKGPFVIAKVEREGRNIGIDENDIQFIMNTFIRTQ